MTSEFEDILAGAVGGTRNRFRDVKSPLPGGEVQEIGMLFINRALDARLSRIANDRGTNVSQVLTAALDLLELEPK